MWQIIFDIMILFSGCNEEPADSGQVHGEQHPVAAGGTTEGGHATDGVHQTEAGCH